MPDTNPIIEARSLLRQKRATMSADLARVDQAIAALDALLGDEAAVPAKADTGRSVRSMVVALLEEEEGPWTTDQVIAEYERRGDPIQAQDVANSVRSAMAKARVKGVLVHAGTGRYRHSKWGQPPPAESVPGTPESQGTNSVSPREVTMAP